MDLLPTVAALAQVELPANRIIDGKDIRPLLFWERAAIGHPREPILLWREKLASGPQGAVETRFSTYLLST